ncbi:tc1-like transposase protein [Trichonephila clavipes]|nr:tc1-like transposase protein [Trichonephila clavipes]
MAPKKSELPISLRERIVSLRENGLSYREIDKKQDNDPKHTAGVTRMWLLYHVPRKLATSPQSPDLNPSENLWNSLDLKIRKRKISSKSALKQALIEEWSNTDPTVTENLIKTMPARLQAVIDAKGMHIKY